jgi:3-isopropylmalate/(R)-2-methylmalate dehydratase large subunit
MGRTIIEKIISRHAGRDARAGEIHDVAIDARLARDFGGANVVKNLVDHGLDVAEPGRTFFTFDCNPTGSDQKYATNQQKCRVFARESGIRVFDIDAGIGTHIAIEDGLVGPGGTLVSTDSHANILGAIGAFGQGMGDQDIAAAWAKGRVWFKVPPTVKVVFRGTPPAGVTAKDIALALLGRFGADGLLGCAAEMCGDPVAAMDLPARITIASLATEMGAIILLFPPTPAILDACRRAGARDSEPAFADADATYREVVEIDLSQAEPMVSRPGHPEDVTPVKDVAGRKIDSAFLGSCTNGRYEDLAVAAELLRGRHVAPGVVFKVVPATRKVWDRCLADGLIDVFMKAGCLVGNAGCAGCAAGQIGQNGPGEVTISTGNRNFEGKQGKGQVYLASPETVTASAIAGAITTADRIPEQPALFAVGGRRPAAVPLPAAGASAGAGDKPTRLRGRVWVVDKDNIDTDMIFHNRYLAITEIAEMGRYTFDNLKGWEDFAQKAQRGDIVVTGRNFGAGSSRQQAVDCFTSLGIQAIVARSFGAIYERNAINAGLPLVTGELVVSGIANGEEVEIDLATGTITRASGAVLAAGPFSPIQMEIYRKGGLLAL